jgi:hypothetical protein
MSVSQRPSLFGRGEKGKRPKFCSRSVHHIPFRRWIITEPFLYHREKTSIFNSLSIIFLGFGFLFLPWTGLVISRRKPMDLSMLSSSPHPLANHSSLAHSQIRNYPVSSDPQKPLATFKRMQMDLFMLSRSPHTMPSHSSSLGHPPWTIRWKTLKVRVLEKTSRRGYLTAVRRKQTRL